MHLMRAGLLIWHRVRGYMLLGLEVDGCLFISVRKGFICC